MGPVAFIEGTVANGDHSIDFPAAATFPFPDIFGLPTCAAPGLG